jgi:hypothetical protein
MNKVKRLFILFLLFIGISLPGVSQEHEILSYFFGLIKDDIIILKWGITGGNTCNGILINHSVDDFNYEQIGEIPGICGSQITEVPYTFIDDSPVSGQKNYYKLELGLQGSSTPLIITFYNTGEDGYLLFPNPGNDLLQIVVTGNGEPIELEYRDVNGRIIGNFNSNSGRVVSIPTTEWVSGVYLINIYKSDKLIASPRWVKN